MRINTLLLCATALAAAGLLAPARAAEGGPSYEPLVVTGENPQGNGIYNPSMAYTADGQTGWLVYSAIRQGGKYLKQVPIGPYCETHLARTTDGGKTWSFVQAINQSVDDMLKNYEGQKLPGVWRYDVPSIVHDPGDPGREWKVFTHYYFWNLQNDRMPAYGWIAMQTASDPAGQWTAPQPLFGSDLYPPKPYQFTRINVNALDKSLRGTLVYTEPGAYCFQRYGTLYLSLTALIKTGPEKIVLLTSADHGSTWSFVSTLVTNADAAQLGYKRFDGSAIAGQAGRVFFLVSPDNGAAEHFGTMVIEFDDLYTGKLQRGIDGKLVVQKHFHEPAESSSKAGTGQSCYDEHNTYGGVPLPQVIMKNAPRIFQIWSTHQSLIGGHP
ncbi:MAG: sialidase family protein [Chthoniobacter sp.]|nr:sialidase family protein [Chthoniobacter sp.]